MENKTYITPEYQETLDTLAERLMANWRAKNAKDLGQLALFELGDESREG